MKKEKLRQKYKNDGEEWIKLEELKPLLKIGQIVKFMKNS